MGEKYWYWFENPQSEDFQTLRGRPDLKTLTNEDLHWPMFFFRDMQFPNMGYHNFFATAGELLKNLIAKYDLESFR